MGCESWITNEGKPIVAGKHETVFLLVPKKFGGKNISDTCYSGYSSFGGYDAYELVADWNKEYLSELSIHDVPRQEDYKNSMYEFEKEELRKEGKSDAEIEKIVQEKAQKNYERAVLRYKWACERILDFKVMSHEKMIEKYGEDYKREIGIDIACYDEDNLSLPYPLKFSFSDMKYEDAKPAISDPDQGTNWSASVSSHEYDEKKHRFKRVSYGKYYEQRLEECKPVV